MNQFRTDNTEGFSAAKLENMNGDFYADLAEAFADLPDGLAGADDDTIAQITQTIAENVLRQYGAA